MCYNITMSKSSPSSDYILALDIGTEYVKAILARRSKQLEIVGVSRIRQDPSSMLAGAISDITAVVKTCERAIALVEEMAGEGISADQTVIGIAGELVKGTTKTIKYQRADPRKSLTAEEMTRIVKKVEQVAGAHARQAIAIETNNPNAEVRLVNSAIVNLYIDGYKVTNPIGFKGSSVAVQIYTAFAPLVHISALEKVADELALDLIAISVEPFAVTRACMGDDPDSALTTVVVDIGGGTTDIAVVDDGGVEGTESFGIGGRSFTHQISERLGVDLEAAEQLKLHQDDERLDPMIRKKLDKTIASTVEVWLSGVELALESFTNVESLPTKILLAGGGASLIDIPEILATSDWYLNLPFARRPIVNLIDPAYIEGIENHTDFPLDHTFITALGLLRIALDSIEPRGTASIRDRFAALLSH